MTAHPSILLARIWEKLKLKASANQCQYNFAKGPSVDKQLCNVEPPDLYQGFQYSANLAMQRLDSPAAFLSRWIKYGQQCTLQCTSANCAHCELATWQCLGQRQIYSKSPCLNLLKFAKNCSNSGKPTTSFSLINQLLHALNIYIA